MFIGVKEAGPEVGAGQGEEHTVLRGSVRVGELIPIRGVWWKVIVAGEGGIALAPHSLTTASLKRAEGARKKARRRKWLAAGRKL
jgi:hypothetical protein